MRNALVALLNLVNGELDDANLKASAGPYAAYRTILEHPAFFSGRPAGLHYIVPGNGNVLIQNTAANAAGALGKEFVPADFSIPGKTAKLRLRARLMCNATAPGVDFTMALHAVASVAGGASLISYSLGAVAAGSALTINTPAANSGTGQTGADFDVPSGLYAIGIDLSGPQAAGSAVVAHIALQQHWV